MATTCGVWPVRRGRSVVAVVVDEAGNAGAPLRFGRSPQDAWALLAYLETTVGLDCELVLPDWLAKSDELARIALERGGTIWLVPIHIIEAVQVVAHLATGPPPRTAATLARLPLAPAIRQHLQRLTPAPQSQSQLSLFELGTSAVSQKSSPQSQKHHGLGQPPSGAASEP